jgi:hypothetical protein
MRLIAAAAAALVILGIAAGVAQGSTGDPVIAGQTNTSDVATTFVGTQTPSECDCHGEPTVFINAASVDRTGLAVSGGINVGGGLLVHDGTLNLTDASINIGIGGGAKKAVYNIFDVGHEAQVIATLQSHRPNLWITAAVPSWQNQTVTIYLNRVIAHPVLVAVAIINAVGP